MQEWKKRIAPIEEEFKPYCYQRLGVEIGWRLIYGIKEHLNFLQQADEKYKPDMYKGLGIGIGWRFGYNMRGCTVLIQQTEQRYRAYLYEGPGTGVARRYGYRVDEQTQEREAAQVPAKYRSQFRKGLEREDNLV